MLSQPGTQAQDYTQRPCTRYLLDAYASTRNDVTGSDVSQAVYGKQRKECSSSVVGKHLSRELMAVPTIGLRPLKLAHAHGTSSSTLIPAPMILERFHTGIFLT